MFGPQVKALTPPRNKQEIEAYICHLSDHKGVIMTFREALCHSSTGPWVQDLDFRGCFEGNQDNQLLVIIQALNVGCTLCFKGHKDNGR